MAEVSGCVGMIQDAKRFAEQYLQKEPDGAYADEAAEILEFVAFEQDDFEELEVLARIYIDRNRRGVVWKKGTSPKLLIF